MKAQTPTDYTTYREIMDELTRPIQGKGLDCDTLKRLYESKLVYLENLRTKCFYEMNRQQFVAHFSIEDYDLILQAIKKTHCHLRELVLHAVAKSLDVQCRL